MCQHIFVDIPTVICDNKCTDQVQRALGVGVGLARPQFCAFA